MDTPIPTSRRDFLHTLAKGAALSAIPGFPWVDSSGLFGGNAIVPRDEPRSLVLIQLEGGNDGFNTWVPLTSDTYHRGRPNLALPKNRICRLTDKIGLNKAAAHFEALFKAGNMAVIQNAEHSNPSPSHFRSSEMWHTGTDQSEIVATGWLGRYVAAAQNSRGYYGTRNVPRILRAPGGTDSTPGSARGTTRISPLSTAGRSLDENLQEVSRLIEVSKTSDVYFVSITGFDTHIAQSECHDRLLRELSGSLGRFESSIRRSGSQNRTLTMVFSEFGRSIGENQSLGTEHGNYSPIIISSHCVRGGFYGPASEMALSEKIDIRDVCSTVMHQWLCAPASLVANRPYRTVDFFLPA